MDTYRQPPIAVQSRADFTWSSAYCVRRDKTTIHDVEDGRVWLNPSDTDSLLKAFFDIRDNILQPPSNLEALRQFLARADLRAFTTASCVTALPIKVALLDDRRDEIGRPGMVRDWESDNYTRFPPQGHSIFREALDEVGLYRRMSANVI